MGLFDGGNSVNPAPQLKQVNSAAQGLYNTQSGFQAPPMKDLYTPFSASTQGALSGISNLAGQGDPLAGQSVSALSGILGSGGGISTGGQLQDLYNNSGNAAFAGAVQNQSDQLSKDIQAQYSGLGRYGSAADTGALATQLGNFRSNMESQNWNQNVANQAGILGQMGNVQQQNVANKMGAVAAAPGAYASQYAPYQMQAQVGAAQDAQNAAKRNAQLARFNATSGAPWARLGAYSGILNGNTQAAQGAGLVQTPNPFGTALGGALSGGQIGNSVMPGGIGAAVGAGIGGIGGLFAGL